MGEPEGVRADGSTGSNRGNGASPDRGGAAPAAPDWDGVERRRVDRRRLAAGTEAGERRSGRERRGLMYHVRDFATRFREPLVGMGMAVAALPLIKTGPSARHRAGQAPTELAQAAPEAAASAAGTGEPNRDVDAEVGSRWNDAARTSTIQAAVNRYGISSQLATSIYDHARKEGIDPKLAYGLVKTESAFNHTAVSNVGARGLTQLMPGTASWMAPGTSARDLFDPETNLKLGFHYLHHLIDRYRGDRHLALTAYNRGPGTVDRAVSRGRNPDNGYAGMVLGNALRGSAGTAGGAGQPGG